MPTYRPSVVCNLKIRFDEALTLDEPPPPEPFMDLVAESGSKPEDPKNTQPLIFQTEDDPSNTKTGKRAKASFVMGRVPKDLNFEKPGYRQAGRFQATFDFRDLPIDPRTVRSAAMEIHVGTVSDADFAAGFRGRDSQGQLGSILQTRDDSGQVNTTTLRMLGVVDEWKLTYGSKGAEAHIEGRDLRGVLLDTPIDAGLGGSVSQDFWDKLDLSQDIQSVVLQVLSWNPFFKDVQVVCNPEEWKDGVLPFPGDRDIVPRHRLGARGKRKGGRGTPNSTSSGASMSFWDVIVKLCYIVGAIPYFSGTGALLIRPASTIFDKIRGPVDPIKNPTPFVGGNLRDRDLETGEPISPALRIRRLVYGRDVEELSYHRKLGGFKRPKVIRAVGFDPGIQAIGTGKVVVGVWPPESELKARFTRVSPGGGISMEEIFTLPVPGVKQLEALTQIARAIYEEFGRSELGGQVSTKNLASFGGSNYDPDLVRLEPGDAVELLTDTRSVSNGAPLVSTVTDSERRSFEEQVQEIQSRLGDENLARVIVATARGQVTELQRFFRVENVKFRWGCDAGLKVDFDFQNYVVARAQIEAASSDPGTAKKQAIPKKGAPNKSGTSGGTKMPTNGPAGGPPGTTVLP